MQKQFKNIKKKIKTKKGYKFKKIRNNNNNNKSFKRRNKINIETLHN